jgi:chaperone required for assembly of F1-ATPase
MTTVPPQTAPKAIYGLQHDEKSFLLTCNDKTLVTPLGHAFRVPTALLGEAIIKEWQSQGKKINPASMPLTQLAATTLDITASDRTSAINRVMAYTPTELLCHRTEEPAALCAEQQRLWQPFLDWMALHYDVLLLTGAGIMPVGQSDQVTGALRRVVEKFDDFTLTGLQQAVETSGSLVLGLALAEKNNTADAVFHAAELETLFQMKKWGEDVATLNRHANLKRELEICVNWFRLLN